ncbi:hypothetical protein ACQEU5_20515 [Marinactinospora thermotolerans]|uniref:hypothetical protein n=1 Tax=Marinactinospora thermotolerans TaxID=531310 RepID=UPI0011867FC6|nr:hypothetical protein [Marinactinospora thermotolerans]
MRTIQPGGCIYVDCFVWNSHGNRWYRTGAGHYTYAPQLPLLPQHLRVLTHLVAGFGGTGR